MGRVKKPENHYTPAKPKAAKKENSEKVIEKAIETKNEKQSSSNSLEGAALTKYILKIAGITVAAIVFTIFYVVSICMSLSPLNAANYFESMGSVNATETAYEQDYKKTGNLSSLYNLIQIAHEKDENDKVAVYVQRLRNHKNYSALEESINNSAREKASLDKVAYVYDVDSYLMNIYMESLYENGSADASKLNIYQDIQLNNDDNVYTNSIITYVDCVFNDNNLSREEKVAKFSFLSDSDDNIIVQRGDTRTMIGWVLRRLELIENKVEETVKGQIFNKYSQIKMHRCLAQVYDILGETTKRQESLNKITTLQTEYDALILSAN